MAKEADPRAVAVWSKYRELINRAELARRIGITSVSVHNWRVVPEGRLVAVSKVIGVPPERLRPDLAPYLSLDPWENL
jgi:hypothetical protein